MTTAFAFVSAPSDTPTVVQTLQPTKDCRILVDGFDLGSPSFDADPYSVGGMDGWRRVSFNVQLSGTYSAVATNMQGIVRQLLEAVNWLEVRYSTASTKPMFLRTYKTQQESLAWEDSGAGVWTLPVTLTCDPFLYGPLQSQSATITNDPANGTNPAWYKLSAVLGDAPTPLRTDLTPSSALDDFAPFMAAYCYDPSVTAPTGPIFWQTAGFSAGTDTTMSTADAAMSGGTRTSTTFATNANMATRFSGTAPSSLEPGRYSVFLRTARSGLDCQYSVQLGRAVGLTGSYVYGDPVSMSRVASPSGVHATWLPLGDYTFPFHPSPVTLDDLGTGAAPDISVQISRTGGAGSVYCDVIMLIPVDTAATVMARQSRTTFYGKGLASTRNGVWDGTRLTPSFRCLTSGVVTGITAPRIDGGVDLWVVPGATNMFALIQQTKLDDPVISAVNSDSISNTTSATLSYYPRYLHLRPDST